MQVAFKQIKKVTVVRKFVFSKSVFHDFSVDTPEKLSKAFELDAQFLKIFKFVKDPVDMANTLAILKKYYGNLKN